MLCRQFENVGSVSLHHLKKNYLHKTFSTVEMVLIVHSINMEFEKLRFEFFLHVFRFCKIKKFVTLGKFEKRYLLFLKLSNEIEYHIPVIKKD